MGDGRASWREWAPWLIPIVALGVFLAPMVLTQSGFAHDWSNHLWLVQRQRLALEAGGPSLYVHANDLGVFYPHFAYYGGSLYVATAALASLIGDTTTAYILSWAVAFAAAFGGTSWLAIQCGLRGWRAQLPGLFLTTAAYFITNAYGRGSWNEFVAVAVLPLVIASGLRLVRGPWTPLPLLAFVGSTIVFTGSHNITLLYGALFVAVVAIGLAIAVRRRPTPTEVRRLGALVGVGVLCLGVNLWFLLPDVWFADRTGFAEHEPFYFAYQAFLSSLRVLLHPGRPMYPELAGDSGERIYLQLPVLMFVWIVTALIVLRSHTTRFQRRAAWVLIAASLPLAVLVSTTEPWHWIPRVLRNAQFGYRLESYLLFAAVGLLLIAVCAMQRAPARIARPLLLALVVVTVVSSGLAVWQVFNYDEVLRNRDAVFATGNDVPRTWYDAGVYRDHADATRAKSSRNRVLEFDVGDAASDRLVATVDPPPGPRPIRTNIATGSHLVDVTGLEPLGHTRRGFLVVRRPPGALEGPIVVAINRRGGGPVRVGRVGSLAAGIGLAAVLITVLLASIRRWRRRSQLGGGSEPASADRQQLPVPAHGVNVIARLNTTLAATAASHHTMPSQ